MLLGSVMITIAAQLTTADIAISFLGDSAMVEARYEIASAADATYLSLIRITGQSVEFREQPGLSVATSPGAYRVSLAQDGRSSPTVTLQYTLSGRLSRIPIAVPDVAPPLEGAPVRISVDGLEAGRALNDGFPRLVSGPGGDLLAELESVPGFVRIPPPSGQLSINKVADGSVALLVLFATAFWFLRRRIARARSPAEVTG